jgi:hypothetical protein
MARAARCRQRARFAKDGGGKRGVTPPLQLTTNADMGPAQVCHRYPVDETGATPKVQGAAMQRLLAARCT